MAGAVPHQCFSSFLRSHLCLSGTLTTFESPFSLGLPCNFPAASVSWAGHLLSLLREALPGEQGPGWQEDTDLELEAPVTGLHHAEEGKSPGHSHSSSEGCCLLFL